MSSNQPFQIHWLDLTDLGFTEDVIGIGSHLPGARHRLISRSLEADIGEVQKHHMRHAYVFCEENELIRFGIPFHVLENALKYSSSDSEIAFAPDVGSNQADPSGAQARPQDYEVPISQIKVHHYPVAYGSFPAMKDMMKIIHDVLSFIQNNEKVIFISRDGYGRSSTIAACLLLHTHDDLDAYAPENVYEMMKILMRSTRAIQTVRQYNSVVDFRLLRDEYFANVDNDSESVVEDFYEEQNVTHRWIRRERNLSR